MLKSIFYSCLIFIFISNNTFGGGWPQPKGGGFAKLDAYIINAKNLFDDDGETFEIPKYSFLSTNIYAEAGITDKLTGIIYLPVYVKSTSEPFFGDKNISTSGIGDLDLGARYNLISKSKYVVSGVLLLGIPTGSAEEDELLWTGDGEFNQLLKIEAGISLPANFYLAGGIGYNFRSKGFSDEFAFDIEAGVGLFEQKLYASLKSSARLSMDNGDENVTGGYGIFSNNTSYISIGPEFTYLHKTGLGITFNTYGAFLGRNLLAAPSYSIGIVYKRNP